MATGTLEPHLLDDLRIPATETLDTTGSVTPSPPRIRVPLDADHIDIGIHFEASD